MPVPDAQLPAPNSRKLRYFVTGAAGFVGWKTCELLLRDGHAVTGLDNLNSYYDQSLKQWRLAKLKQFDAFTFIEGDIETEATIRHIFKTSPPFDTVFNLAARAGVRASIETPAVYYTTNVFGSLNLLEAMRKAGIGKYVLASTSSLYAGHPMPFTEDAPVNQPISPYAASKKAAEAMAYTWHHLYGIDVSIVRYFTIYGPAGRPDMSPLRFIKWIDEGTPITLFGDGSQTRDFTYIDDTARGTIAAQKPVGYEVINIGGGNRPVSISHMIACFEKALGKEAKINHQPFHAADMKDTAAQIDKAKALLDWEPRIKPEDGFQRTVDWYLENKAWVSKIDLG